MKSFYRVILFNILVVIFGQVFAFFLSSQTAVANTLGIGSGKVLILDSTVHGGVNSAEAKIAADLGFTVEVIDANGWAAKTESDFAAYRAIILGDPNCTEDTSPLAPAVANKSVWGKAITGNVVVLGTAPVFGLPYGSTNLLYNSIAFAAKIPGKTGAYISLSCYYALASPGTPVPVLDGIAPNGFTVIGQIYVLPMRDRCPNWSHIVTSSHPVISGVYGVTSDETFAGNSLSNWWCSTHEGFVTWPSSFDVIVISRDLPSSYVAPDGARGAPYILAHSAPTPTPTPTPTPAPFLDLPWDYKSLGKSFDQVAFNPVSWFDHQYPLQNVPCCVLKVLSYADEEIFDFYRSHNGYDYGAKDEVFLNTPILAAASGIATFKSTEHSNGAGNVIKIDHGNGYQTWYEHLSKDDLIVSTEGTSISVLKGQKIGKVGMTGNTNGPHIHLSVFKDSNNNKTFDDDYPYGVVDPLGWEGKATDPWETWTDGNRTGTKSYNLFLPRKAPKSMLVPKSGSTFLMDAVQIAVPSGSLNRDFTLTYDNGPFESVSDILKSITPSFFLNAVDSLNQKVTQFLQPIKITYNYANADLFNINEDSLKLYFFNDQTNQWEALTSILNKDNKTITAETTHFSQFTVMGEVKDKIVPTTAVNITGDKGEDNWYRSSLSVELNGKDNDGGVGLQYTLYTLNDNDWLVYDSPLIFDKEGSYKITYQSIDKAENKEDRKTLTFHIDKTPPEVKVNATPNTIWPPNGKIVDVTINGSATDVHLFSKKLNVEDEYKLIEPTLSAFGQTIQLEAKRNGNDLDGRVYTIKAVAEDLAGNTKQEQTQVVVPHDQRK